MTLQQLKTDYQETPEYHDHIKQLFTSLVEKDAELNDHRKWVRDRVYGMGEDAFHWFWKLLVDKLPDGFSFIEIGVHKAQIISLIRLLSDRIDKYANIYGITPMDGTGTGWQEDDYKGDIIKIHNEFGLEQPRLFKGLSQDKLAVKWAEQHHPFDVGYVDGDHSYSGAKFDLDTYAPMIISGGWLVVDDAACRTHQNFGEFQGIKEVCDALADWEETPIGKTFEFQFNIIHLMVYKRI